MGRWQTTSELFQTIVFLNYYTKRPWLKLLNFWQSIDHRQPFYRYHTETIMVLDIYKHTNCYDKKKTFTSLVVGKGGGGGGWGSTHVKMQKQTNLQLLFFKLLSKQTNYMFYNNFCVIFTTLHYGCMANFMDTRKELIHSFKSKTFIWILKMLRKKKLSIY
jgi:hypothetical protein